MIADDKCHNLARSSAQGSPQPRFCRFDENKRPDFIQFKNIVMLGGQETFFDGGLLRYLFLSMLFKVLREI
jgi:hypothetical protein